MSLSFDSPSEFEEYDWETVSPMEWQDCINDMVCQVKEKKIISSPCCGTSYDDDSLHHTELSVSTLHCNTIENPCTIILNSNHDENKKRHKLMQLVLLQEIWARTGTDREAFYQSLCLLESMNLFDLQGLKKSHVTDKQITLSDPMLLPKNISNTKSCNWYDIVEKTLERLPSNIPLTMNTDSPLSNLLNSFLIKSENGESKQLPQITGKLVSLLKQSRFITDFEPVGFIGKGGFGTVLKAKQKSEDFCYAIKIVRFKDFAVPSNRFQRVFREVTTLARLDHVNIVRYYSAWLELTEEYEELLNELNSDSNDEFSPSFEDSSEFESYSDEDIIKINAGGSVEIGFHNILIKKPLRKSVPSLYKAESFVQLPVTPKNHNQNLKRMKRTRTKQDLLRRTTAPKKVVCAPITVTSSSQSSIIAKQFDYTLFIQMQLYEHDTLKQWLHNPKRVIDKKDNLRIFAQIIAGLQHVHAHDLLHRDLKPANIFLSKDGIIKIGDFGLSRDLDKTATNLPSQITSSLSLSKLIRNKIINTTGSSTSSKQTFSIGTPGYVAPEILKGDMYGPKVDVYSLGIILMELFTKTSTKHEKVINLTNLRERIVPESIQHNYPDMGDLILALTEPNPSNRLSLDEVAENIEFALDDYKHLRHQIQNQEKIIIEQQELIHKLQKEIEDLKNNKKT